MPSAVLPDSSPVAPPNRIDLAECYKLRVLNKLSINELAEYFGVRKQSVSEALQRFAACLPDSPQRDAYEQARPMLLSAVEEQLMASLTDPAKLEKASLNNVAYAFTQVHTARRLEQGQSTSNLAVWAKCVESAHQGLYEQAKQTQEKPKHLEPLVEATDK